MDSPDVTLGSGAPGSGAASSVPAGILDRARRRFGGGKTPPPPPPDGSDSDDEEGMARMSFLEHLEELRSRIIKALIGVAVAFAFSLLFCDQLWNVVRQP